MLQIQDNGHGIRQKDFPILCERFTTSKIREFNDLRQVASFGFRGEALASISYCSRLNIQSRTADSELAYSADFREGLLLDTDKGVTVSETGEEAMKYLKPCAG